MQPRKNNSLLIITLIILVLLALVVFWFFFMRGSSGTGSTTVTDTSGSGFSPFGRPGSNQQGNNGSNTTDNGTSSPSEVTIPVLRLLSATPIGGYGATTTASTTIVRWIDRGRGNILEAKEDSLDINTLSNTLLPKVYESVWNADATSFVGSMLADDNQTINTVFATLIPQKATTTTPYELRGTNLPSGIVASAVSPKKDKVFFLIVKNGQGVGYVAPLNGGTATQIFSTPVTEVNVEWPEENTIAITTKGTADQSGYLYFVNPKTGVWTKILGSLPGLSTRVSHDAKYVLLSASGNADDVVTYIYSVASSTATDAIIHTLADKCAWGNFYKDIVYCAVPFQPVSGTYPDDWYKGTLSTIDKIWQVNAQTGEVHLISPVFSVAKRNIDAFNLGLDSKDNYLFFMNKYDLSFWSLDLVRSTSGN
jgi:hypothetical protein